MDGDRSTPQCTRPCAGQSTQKHAGFYARTFEGYRVADTLAVVELEWNNWRRTWRSELWHDKRDESLHTTTKKYSTVWGLEFCDTLGNVKSKCLNHTPANTPVKRKAQTLGCCEGEAVNPLADTLQPAKADTNFDTLRNIMVEVLVDTLTETVLDKKANTLFGTLNAKLLMDKLADTLGDAEAELLGEHRDFLEADTRLQRKRKTLLITLGDEEAVKIYYTVGMTWARDQDCGKVKSWNRSKSWIQDCGKLKSWNRPRSCIQDFGKLKSVNRPKSWIQGFA